VRVARDAEIRTPSLHVVFVLSRFFPQRRGSLTHFWLRKVTTDPHILAQVSTYFSNGKFHPEQATKVQKGSII